MTVVHPEVKEQPQHELTSSDCEVTSIEGEETDNDPTPAQWMKELETTKVANFHERKISLEHINNIPAKNPIEPFDPIRQFAKSRSPSPWARDEGLLKSYLPPKDWDSPEYTLVLDLDETLIHFTDKKRANADIHHHPEEYFNIRPYCQKFLQEMSKHFELVIFTAATQEYADWILDQIDLWGWVSHRLYRQHTHVENQVHM